MAGSITELVRQLVRKTVPAGVRSWIRRRLLGPPPNTAKLIYEQEARIGADSPNQWIRKSSQINGWLFPDEPEFLWELACRSVVGDVLEIGTWMGKSACILAGASKEHAPGTRVICVDTFCMTGTPDQEVYHHRLVTTAGTFYDFLTHARNLGFHDIVLPVAALSTEALTIIRGPLRMVFIDGSHDRENCGRDVELCLPLVAPGGIIAVHDTSGGQWPGVEEYVRQSMMPNPNLRYLGTKGTIAAFEKLSPSHAG